jgi:hypothetical protein
MQVYLTKLSAKGAALELSPGNYVGEWSAYRCTINGVHYKTDTGLKTITPQKCRVRIMGAPYDKFGMITRML